MPDPSRRLLIQQPPAAHSRRVFLRRAVGVTAAALGGPLLIPDEAWAGIEERAARLGITPGTLVDAQGRPVGRSPVGTDPFIGEVAMFGCNFAPRGYAFCNGQTLQIAQNTALFSIIGTIYGGDGRQTVGLPDLRSRFPMHEGQGPGLSNRVLGQRGGTETETLTVAQIPGHSHGLAASTGPGTTDDPANGVPAVPASSIPTYATAGTAAAPDPTETTGGGGAHENVSPFLAINFCIALEGVFPSRS